MHPPAAEAAPVVGNSEIIELAQATQGAGEAIGTVSAVEGQVAITRADGDKVQAQAGTPIFQGDLVETKAAGAVGITFADDSTFSLADNGSMVIDQMVYDPSTKTGKSAISVAEGVFTFVSGQIAKTDVDAMTITTPVAVIGIRGTAGGGKAGPEGTPNTFSMFVDPSGAIGEMNVRTQGGTVTFNKPLQTTQISSQFLPPLKPITLPAQVAQQFFAKATAVQAKPVIAPAAAGPTGDQQPGGPTGDQQAGGPTGDQPPAAADKAAADAFEQALAQGQSLDAAIANAVVTAGASDLKDTLAANPNAFGSEHSGDTIMSRIVDNVLLRVTGNIDPLGAGDGKGAGHGNLTNNFFSGGVDDLVASGLQAVAKSGFFSDDFFDHNRIGPEGRFFESLVDDPFRIFNKTDFERNFDFGFEDFLFDVFTPLTIEGGVLGFNENPFFLEPGETAFVTTGAFDEFISNFTTGSESRTGGNGNTRFTMVQGTTLGGADSLDGGAGTDELALEKLSNMAVIFNGSSKLVSYSNSGNSISGSVSLTSVEQIFADDGLDARVRFPINLADDDAGFFGYILVGSGSNDTLSLATGTNLASTYGGLSGVTGATVAASGATRAFGALIFGNNGDDTITGTYAGDIIFGGAGADTIDPGTPPAEDGDALTGGAGADTFKFGTQGTYFGSIKGGNLAGVDDSTGTTIGSNADTIQLSAASGTYQLKDMITQGIEVLDVTATGVTLTHVGTFFQSLLKVQSAGTTTLRSETLDFSDISGSNTPGTGVGTLTYFDVSGSNPVGTIKDFNDSVGRTLNGSSANSNFLFGFGGGDTLNGGTGRDEMTGGLGADTIDLKSDSSADLVKYTSTSDGAAAGATSGFDVITNFDRADGDRVHLLTTGNLAGFDDNGNGSVSSLANIAAGNSQLNTAFAEIVYFSTAVSDVNLTGADSFAAVIASIGSVVANNTSVTTANENDAVFVIKGATKSGVFLYQADSGSSNTAVAASELTLLATYDAVAQEGDVLFSAS